VSLAEAGSLNRHIIVTLVARWRKQVLWTGGIIVTLVVLAVLIRIGHAYHWTGFGQSRVNGDVQPAKKLWDWLDLLIVPVVLAIGGYLFTRSESKATQAAEEKRAQDEALQAYLDKMSDMLIPNEDLLSSHEARPGDSLSSMARARTLTLLTRLDGNRKASAVQFLYEAGLIARGHPIVALSGAYLRGANLRGANLSDADLSEADLIQADLRETDLRRTNLSGADLRGAHLFEADLREADLSKADLMNATGGVTNEELEQQAASLEGAVMLNGWEYEHWLKSKSRESDG
jgi:hypothetical protein